MDIKEALKGIYPIIDTTILSHSDAPCAAKSIVRAGATILQLRHKGGSSGSFLRLARKLREITRPYSTLFIVNDRVDIALLSGADGVHLGTEDIPPQQARRLLGRDAIIGLSTHNPDEVRAAQRLYKEGIIDYISFGPIYPTTTKPDARPTVGTELLRSIVGLTDAPVVAIGGIKAENVAEVVNSGADSVAMISALLSAPDLESHFKRLLRLCSMG